MKSLMKDLAREIKVYQLVLRDPRTPTRAKVFLGMAVGYFLSPVDIIPDFIPILGQIDDAFIVPALLWLAKISVPAEVMEDCRRLADQKKIQQSSV